MNKIYSLKAEKQVLEIVRPTNFWQTYKAKISHLIAKDNYGIKKFVCSHKLFF